MRRTLDFVLTHLKRIIIALALLPAVSVGISLALPRTYQSEATLWALRRYTVIGATGPESDLQATPAMTQANALSDLLHTRAFDLAVASESNLAAAMTSRLTGVPDNDALVNEVAGKVKVVALGANLYSINYVSAHAAVAQAVVQAVLDNFTTESVQLAIAETQHTLDVYHQQQQDAQMAAEAASTAEAEYLAQHPALKDNGLLLDPHYELLHAQSEQATNALETINAKIASLISDIQTLGADASSLFTIIDAPTLPERPQSRTSLVAIAGAVGLLVAILCVTVYAALGLRRDWTVHDIEELQAYVDVPVLAAIPHQHPRRGKHKGDPASKWLVHTLSEKSSDV